MPAGQLPLDRVGPVRRQPVSWQAVLGMDDPLRVDHRERPGVGVTKTGSFDKVARVMRGRPVVLSCAAQAPRTAFGGEPYSALCRG